jgi:hypothetical protein
VTRFNGTDTYHSTIKYKVAGSLVVTTTMTAQTMEISAPDHPVKSVTVFKWSKAEVVRTFEVDIKVLSLLCSF